MRPGFARLALATLSTAVLVCSVPAIARAETTHTVVMLPIVVHSADSREYLQQGLADMLASRMTQTGGFRLIRVDDPGDATSNLDEALARGRRYGRADFVLFGSFTRFGTGASLDMQCAALRGPADAEPLREIFVHSGSIGEVIPDLDELVGKIARFTQTGRPSPPGSVASAPAGEGQNADKTDVGALERRVKDLETRLDALEADR